MLRITPAAFISLLFLFVSCSDPKTRALKKLSSRGIPPEAIQVPLAIANNDDEALEQLLICGVHANHHHADGSSPLQMACATSNFRAVSLLLEKGSGFDISQESELHPSALAYAAAKADIPIAKALIARKANLDTLSITREPLLVWCIAHGRYIIAESLIHAGADLQRSNQKGLSALDVAIEKQQRHLVELLLSKGATSGKPEKTSSHQPILHRCMELEWGDLIPLLVKQGVDINVVNAAGKSAVDIALESGKTEQFYTLVKLGASSGEGGWDQRLWVALHEKNHAQLQTLLNAGIKPTGPDAKGRSLLEVALEQSDAKSIDLLLSAKAPIGTAYHRTCELGDLRTVMQFEDAGFPPSLRPEGSYDSPLHCAVRGGNAQLVAHLIRHGADVHELGRENQTPLVCAIARSNAEIAKVLLQHKADPNRKLEPAANDSFLAAISGNGMKWYLRKDRNLTPIMLAADTGNIGLARALLDAGASTTAWTAVNKTWPLNFASRKGDVSMMRLLLKKDPQVENQKIIVSLSAQRATVFNAVGEIIYTTRISSGKKGFATPKRTFVITNKYREWKSTIYDGASMPYFQRFSCSDFGFHQGVVPGYPASHGCLRVPAGSAQKLFSLTELGDRVIIK